MEISHKAQTGETSRGVRREDVDIVDPLASRAAENILDIFDRLSINSEERDFMKIPVVSAYVQGMQALQHDKRSINFDGLKEQIYYAMARELAHRQALVGKKP